jgi:hypothetical protein
MTQPPEDPPRQAPLPEAVEQAADAARLWLRDLQRFAEEEATALGEGRYGLVNLATAPARLLAILVRNSIATNFTISDNLALLASSGRFSGATARRALRVGVTPTVLPNDVEVEPSDLVGRLTNYRIRAGKIDVDASELATDGVVILNVSCPAAPPDIYLGTLNSTDGPPPTLSEQIAVAINEIGNPLA